MALAAELTDTSLMPFGKFKGKLMKNVPAPYLHWFYTSAVPNNVPGKMVFEYIEKHLNALKKEYPDGIWTPAKPAHVAPQSEMPLDRKSQAAGEEEDNDEPTDIDFHSSEYDIPDEDVPF